MKNLSVNFKQKYWHTRSAQERRTLSLGAWLLAPLLVYFALWQPAHSAVKKMQPMVASLRIQADRLHAQAVEIEKLRHLPQPALLDASALKALLETSAASHPLLGAVNSLVAQEPNAVRVSLDSVSFAAWLDWLRELQQTQHIRADSVSIVPLADSGLVKISATLSNGVGL
jgi:general secretion pathway protein M